MNGHARYHRLGSGASKNGDLQNNLQITNLGLAFRIGICENDFTAGVGERTECAILKCGRIVAKIVSSAERRPSPAMESSAENDFVTNQSYLSAPSGQIYRVRGTSYPSATEPRRRAALRRATR